MQSQQQQNAKNGVNGEVKRQTFQNIHPTLYPDSQQQFFKQSMSFGEEDLQQQQQEQQKQAQQLKQSQQTLQNPPQNSQQNQQIRQDQQLKTNQVSLGSKNGQATNQKEQNRNEMPSPPPKINLKQNIEVGALSGSQSQAQQQSKKDISPMSLKDSSNNGGSNIKKSTEVLPPRGMTLEAIKQDHDSLDNHPSAVLQHHNRTRDQGGTVKIMANELGIAEDKLIVNSNNADRNRLLSTMGRVRGNEENMDSSVVKLNTIARQGTLFGQSILTLTIRSAEKLKNMEVVLKSDPYVEMEFGGYKYKTASINNNLNPIWNQKFTFILDDTINLQTVIVFRVYDQETLFKDRLIGQCEIKIEELLKHQKNTDIGLKLKEEVKIEGKPVMKEVGILKILQKAKPLLRSSAIFGQAPSEEQVQNIVKAGKKWQNGIFKFHMHHFDGFENPPKGDYQVKMWLENIPEGINNQINKDKPNTPTANQYADNFTIEKKSQWQIQRELSFKAQNFFQAKLCIKIDRKAQFGFSSNNLARFECNLGNALELLEGQTLSVEISDDLHSNTQTQNINASPPRVFLSIQYFSSFFTRNPVGDLTMKIKAWTVNGVFFPSTYYVYAKVNNQRVAEFQRLHQSNLFKVSDSMAPIMIIVYNRKLGRDSEIAIHKVYSYELFKNQEQIVYQDNYQPFTFIDNDKKSEIVLSVVTRFTPQVGLFTPEQLRLEGQDQQLVTQMQPKDIKDLQRVQSNFQNNNLDDSNDFNPNDQLKTGAQDFQEREDEIFTLDLVDPKPILESKRGVFVMKIRGCQYEWEQLLEAGAGLKQSQDMATPQNQKDKLSQQAWSDEEPSFYIIVKTSRSVCKTKSVKESNDPVWDEIMDFKVQDPYENYTVKLYQDGQSPILIAEGQIISKDAFANQKCWTALSLTIQLSLIVKPAIQLPLKIDLQYRSSNFTRLPRGKMEISLMSGHQLKYKGLSFERPLFVFKLGLQNFQLCESINSHNAKWNNRMIQFESSSLWDVLELRIYQSASSADNQLELIGSIQKPLNSIMYDDDATSTISLNLMDASDLLFGFIKVQFDYKPIRKGFESEIGDSLKNDNLNTMGQKYRKNDENLGMSEKKRGVCFLTLRSIKVQGMENDQNYNVENVRLDISYQKQKCLSKITTDLNKTQNKETLNDQFRLIIDDISTQKIDNQKIQIKAFDIDYKGSSTQSEIQMLIGENYIDPYLLRMYQGTELHYQVSIEISDSHFLQKLQKNQKYGPDGQLIQDVQFSEQLINENDEREAHQILDSKSDFMRMQRKKKRELVINFSIVYISTNFTKSPFGMITINDISLLNLNNYLADNFTKDSQNGSIYAVFKMNGNKNNTTDAKLMKDVKVTREKMCLFHQEYDPVDVMRGGDDFYVRSSSVKSMLNWDKQIVLFTASPLDQLEIEIIFDKKQTTVDSQGKQIAGKSRSKVVLASILVNIADISYFLDKSATREVSIASLMDFMGSPTQNPAFQGFLNLSQQDSKIAGGASQQLMLQLKMQKIMSSKDLLNQAYARQLILMMDIKFASDVFIERDQMKNNLNIDHLFMIPREVKYNDYIEQGYDEWLKKNQNKQQQAKQLSQPGSPIKKNRDGVLSPPMSPSKKQVAKQLQKSNNHMLVEFHLLNLNSILRDVASATNNQNNIFCFIAFEYLSNTDSVSSYIKQSGKYLKNQIQKLNQLNTGDRIAAKNDQKALNNNSSAGNQIVKVNKVNHVFGDIINDFFAPPEELLSLDTQMTEIFGINDFEIHSINQMLEGWVPISTNKIMLSLIIQQNDVEQLKSFKETLLQQVLNKDTTILGIQKFGAQSTFSHIEVYQTPIDFEFNLPNVINVGNQQQQYVSYEPSILKTFTQCANLAELAFTGNLLMNPITRAQCFVRTRLQTSKFIDTPSGYLNIALKKLSHNSLNFNQDNYVKLTLKSKVGKEKIINFNSQICDFKETQNIGFYKKRSESNNKTVVMMNEVANFIVRHFADTLIISIYNNSPQYDQPALIFQTKVELNNLDLNDEKLTILVVGTHAMRNKGSPVYYTFEFDMLFKSKLLSQKDESNMEFAYENYKLLKGSDTLTQAEEQIIKMLMERAALAKLLIPNRIRLRKAFFILRNMVKTSYQSIDLEEQSHFRVLPKSFFFNLNDPNLNLTEMKSQEIMQRIKQELSQGKVRQNDSNQLLSMDIKYKSMPLEKGGQIEKSNMLVIEFMNNIQVQHGGGLGGTSMISHRSMLGQTNNAGQPPQLGLSRPASGMNNMLNQSHTSLRSLTGISVQALMRYKKMVLVVTQDEQTVCKHTFDKIALLSGQFMKGLRIFIKDIKASNVLTFRILVEEEKDGLQNKSASSGFNKPTATSAFGGGEGKLTQLGYTTLQIGTLNLKTWTKQEKTLAISHFSVNVSLNLLYSDFTKNPHKVVNFTFHRLISILPEEIVRRQTQNETDQANQTNPKSLFTKATNVQTSNKDARKAENINTLLNQERFNYKLVMKDDSIITKNNFKDLILDKDPSKLTLDQINSQTSNNFLQTHNSGFGNAMRSKFAKNYFTGSASKSQIVPHDGSINQKLEQLQYNDIEKLDVKLKVIIEFDNCLEYKGEVRDTRVFDIDQFGKHLSSDLEKIMINNTKCDNKIIFKLCLDNTGNGNNDYMLNSKANVVIAQTSLYLAEIQTLPNQVINFFIPIKSLAENSMPTEENISTKWALQNFNVNNAYILGSIRITDKTFGELSINIDQFKSIPRSLDLREIQYKVQVHPSNVQSKDIMLQTILNKTQSESQKASTKTPPQNQQSKDPAILSKQQQLELKRKEKELLTSLGAPQEMKNYETYSFESQRIEYTITVSKYQIQRDFNIPLTLKDIFSDVDAFLNPRALELYQDLDNKLVFQLLGYDSRNNCIELGQIELSMLEMIQKQLLNEQNIEKNQKFQALASQSGEFKQQQYSQVAQKKLDKEFAGTSAKFQKLFKDSYVRYNQTKEVLQKQKEDEINAKQQEQQDKKFDQTQKLQTQPSEPLPDGFSLIKFDKPKPMKDPFSDLYGQNQNPQKDEKLELSQSASKKQAGLGDSSIFNSSPTKQLQNSISSQSKEEMSDLIVKIEWNFSYKLREKHSDKFNEINEEFRQLERIKQKKNIANLLQILEQVQNVPLLTHKNLKTLALVLASESCLSYNSEEDLLSVQGLQNVERIIGVLTQLYKEARLELHSLIELMRCITYLKILCDTAPSYKSLFRTTIKSSLLIETMIETYQQQIMKITSNMSISLSLKSKLLIMDISQFNLFFISIMNSSDNCDIIPSTSTLNKFRRIFGSKKSSWKVTSLFCNKHKCTNYRAVLQIVSVTTSKSFLYTCKPPETRCTS